MPDRSNRGRPDAKKQLIGSEGYSCSNCLTSPPHFSLMTRRLQASWLSVRGFGEGISIETPGEVSYDKSHQKRVGRAILKGKNSSEAVYYTVDWQNRSKGLFWVQIQDHP